MLFKDLVKLPNFFELVDEKLEKIVRENPDVIYGNGKLRCSYYKPTNICNSNGCIFGRAFQELGIKEPCLKYLDFIGSITSILDHYNVIFSYKKYHWELIQTFQDDGNTWKESLERSKHANRR